MKKEAQRDGRGGGHWIFLKGMKQRRKQKMNKEIKHEEEAQRERRGGGGHWIFLKGMKQRRKQKVNKEIKHEEEARREREGGGDIGYF